jgi:hypothetical protein
MSVIIYMNISKKEINSLLVIQKQNGDCIIPKLVYCDDCPFSMLRKPRISQEKGCPRIPDKNLERINKFLYEVEQEDPVLLFECQLLML